MLNDQLIDKRIVERNIKSGKIDAAEYARMLGALPDLSSAVFRGEDARAPAQPAVAAAEAPRGGWSEESAQPAPFG